MMNLKIHNFFLQEIFSTRANRLVREEIHNTDTKKLKHETENLYSFVEPLTQRVIIKLGDTSVRIERS